MGSKVFLYFGGAEGVVVVLLGEGLWGFLFCLWGFFARFFVVGFFFPPAEGQCNPFEAHIHLVRHTQCLTLGQVCK